MWGESGIEAGLCAEWWMRDGGYSAGNGMRSTSLLPYPTLFYPGRRHRLSAPPRLLTTYHMLSGGVARLVVRDGIHSTLSEGKIFDKFFTFSFAWTD